MRHRKLFCRYSMLAFYVITKSCNRQSFQESFQAIISSNHFKQSLLVCRVATKSWTSGNFVFNQGKSWGKKDVSRNREKPWKFSVSSCFTSGHWIFPYSITHPIECGNRQISSFWILFCFYAVLMKHCSVFYGNRKVEWPK